MNFYFETAWELKMYPNHIDNPTDRSRDTKIKS